jgi:hypothetical protein
MQPTGITRVSQDRGYRVGGGALRRLLVWIGACGVGLFPTPGPAQDLATSPVIYVARRGWHIDIGFAQADLKPPLNSLAAEFPGMRYLFFGFGDQQYLASKNHNAPVLFAALWPGRGVLLITGLSTAPSEAFGSTRMAVLTVTRQQLNDAEAFVWKSLDRQAGAHSSARGPYDGSLYFAAAPRYSAFHTCNTWAAEVLKAAALPIHSAGVVFASQLWTQVLRVERDPRDSAKRPPLASAAAPSR